MIQAQLHQWWVTTSYGDHFTVGGGHEKSDNSKMFLAVQGAKVNSKSPCSNSKTFLAASTQLYSAISLQTWFWMGNQHTWLSTCLRVIQYQQPSPATTWLRFKAIVCYEFRCFDCTYKIFCYCRNLNGTITENKDFNSFLLSFFIIQVSDWYLSGLYVRMINFLIAIINTSVHSGNLWRWSTSCSIKHSSNI